MISFEIVRRAILVSGAAIVSAGVSSAGTQPSAERVLQEGRISVGIHNQVPSRHVGNGRTVDGAGPDMIKTTGIPNSYLALFQDFKSASAEPPSRRIDPIAKPLGTTINTLKDSEPQGKLEQVNPIIGLVVLDGREADTYAVVAFWQDDVKS